MLTVNELKLLLHYDPMTGVFTRLVASGRSKKGSVAGSLNSKGYIQIAIKGVRYMAHRLAWLFMTGEWPADQVDHENLNKQDNSWENLRDATNVQNNWNKIAGTPYVGVTKRGDKFEARLCIAGARLYLGRYSSAEEAKQVRDTKAQEMHGAFFRA